MHLPIVSDVEVKLSVGLCKVREVFPNLTLTKRTLLVFAHVVNDKIPSG
jgi:hypothetical protein